MFRSWFKPHGLPGEVEQVHIIPWHHALPAGMGIRGLGRIRRVFFRTTIKNPTLAQSLRRHIPLVPVDGECLERGRDVSKTFSTKEVLKEKCFLTK